jgi:DNA polymerase (family X)
MAAAARANGLKYLAITDHAQHLGIVRGLDADRFARQSDEIDELNATLTDFVILKGAEVDILEDGSLPLSDAVLRKLDVVIVSVHTHFELPRAKQTARILRALEHPHVSILGHPTGRLLGERAGYVFDFDAVLAAAKDRGCFLELNSQPQRLDIDDVMAQAARDQGVLVSIDSDAHASVELANLAGGIRQARRGWLRPEDVLNARPLGELKKLLARARA